jgi:hypothetical protein
MLLPAVVVAAATVLAVTIYSEPLRVAVVVAVVVDVR